MQRSLWTPCALTWSLWLHCGSGAPHVDWHLPPPSPPYWYDHLGARALRYGLSHQGQLTEGLLLWCFPHKTGHLKPLVLWCRSHISVLEGFGRTPGSVFPLIMRFTCGITRYFPFFLHRNSIFSQHALDFIGLLWAIYNLFFFFLIYSYWGIYWHEQFYSINICFFSPHQIRLLVKACHRLCRAMSVRLLCPPPRVHLLCLNPVAHLRQPQPQLLQARWDTENELF